MACDDRLPVGRENVTWFARASKRPLAHATRSVGYASRTVNSHGHGHTRNAATKACSQVNSLTIGPCLLGLQALGIRRLKTLGRAVYYSAMEPTQELFDALFMDKVRQARLMSPAEKLLAGPRLFEQVCRWMMAGIRNEYPDADEQEVQRILTERLELARRLEETR